MFSAKCANRECQTAFEYLLARFYRFHMDSADFQMPANTHNVIHLWLCDRCPEEYRLEYRYGKSVLVPLRASAALADTF